MARIRTIVEGQKAKGDVGHPEHTDIKIHDVHGVRNFADFPFADRTFADGHLLIRHLLTGPGHLLTQTFADFSQSTIC